MENLIGMYEALPLLMKVFWGCALFGSLFMVVQLVLSLVGIGDTDIDFSGDSLDGLDASGGMDLFTIKNMVNFFVGFGWGGVTFGNVIEADWLLVLVAVLCGCVVHIPFQTTDEDCQQQCRGCRGLCGYDG